MVLDAAECPMECTGTVHRNAHALDSRPQALESPLVNVMPEAQLAVQMGTVS